MNINFVNGIKEYSDSLIQVLKEFNYSELETLINELYNVLIDKKQVFIMGNGGSAANALHMSNDLFYGIGEKIGRGIRAIALPANQSILTCLANDVSYDEIFSKQLTSYAKKDDILIALSGSGNSENIYRAILEAKKIGLKTFGIFAFSGGKCKDLVDNFIHVPIDDMEIAEDMQQIISHMIKRTIIKIAEGNKELSI